MREGMGGGRPATPALLAVSVIAVAFGSAVGFFDGDPGLPLGTTLTDFDMPGTQPDPSGSVLSPILHSNNCILCHGSFDEAEPPLPADAEPYRNWAGSMMGQAARDPEFWAAMTVANQDAGFAGDLCLRCHSPAAWLAGRSLPTDGTALIQFTADFEGVTCHFCHRLVDPVYEAGVNPVEDDDIHTDLFATGDLPPADSHTGQYIVDPDDNRRGPFVLQDPDGGNFSYHAWLQSPFHREAALCGLCHDVSNPQYTKQMDGSYALNAVDTPHLTMDKYEMFPIERTYSEWLMSEFAGGGVQMYGRFGGNHPTGVMETCQDCHMPDQVSPGCRVPGFPDRSDMAAHFLNGGNTWVLSAIDDLYTDGDPGEPNGDPMDDVFLDAPTGLTPEIIAAAMTRVATMHADASDMVLTQSSNRLNVRIYNMTGHKLPTGYPEGRRMWLNLKFFDIGDTLIQEQGAYDFVTGVLVEADTKVYEIKLGIDNAVAGKTGLPEGESFHFVLNNEILKDNRIPPLGFSNAGFAAVQAAPVGYSYDDGHNWDDTVFVIPPGAVRVVVTLYYQTTTKEYADFLQAEAGTRGQIFWNQWNIHGRSAPAIMDSMEIVLDPLLPGDLDNDGDVDASDFFELIALWGPCPDPCPPVCKGDLDGNCQVDFVDFVALLANWTF
jgi:hypothetical protein